MDSWRCFIGKRQHQWDLHIPQLAGALRSAVNRSTGYNPNKLIIGREADLVFPLNKADRASDVDEYVSQLENELKKGPRDR